MHSQRVGAVPGAPLHWVWGNHVEISWKPTHQAKRNLLKIKDYCHDNIWRQDITRKFVPKRWQFRKISRRLGGWVPCSTCFAQQDPPFTDQNMTRPHAKLLLRITRARPLCSRRNEAPVRPKAVRHGQTCSFIFSLCVALSDRSSGFAWSQRWS